MDRKTTVLLVDDDVDFTESNRLALEAAGYEVVVAHDGNDGYWQAKRNKVDVAILDVMMNRPNEGFELARQLRNDVGTCKVPLLMLSSINAVNASRGDSFRFSDKDRDEVWLPIDRFVDKPVSAERLVGLVRELAR